MTHNKFNPIRRRRRERHRLTDRDRAILKYIAETKPRANNEMVRKKFWPDQTDNHHHYRRLRALRRMGLIRGFAKGWGFGFCICITKQGREMLATN